MSREKVDATDVELWAAAFNGRDLPTLRAMFSGDALLEEQPDFSPNPATYRGWEEIARYWTTYDRTWENLRVAVEESRLVGDDLVMFCRFTAHGRLSGAPVEARIVVVPTLRDGKVARLRLFGTPQSALEAMGLRG
jgi:ketosteroid isomerase-like protein